MVGGLAAEGFLRRAPNVTVCVPPRQIDTDPERSVVPMGERMQMRGLGQAFGRRLAGRPAS